MNNNNILFYNGCFGRQLSTKRKYYTLLADNTSKWPNYSLIEIQDTRQYVGKFLNYYITGFSDNRCGHYVFLNGHDETTVHDEYSGRRAFCLDIPIHWFNSKIPEDMIFANANEILNSLLVLSSAVRQKNGKKINILCSVLILTCFNFPVEMNPRIFDIFGQLVFERKLTL